jgi:putative component of toxin-antitoxin plasmid stabilization module
VDVREYLTADGRNPYREWLDTLDVTPRARIQARVLRYSTGYRIYFARDGLKLVLLLLGGDKSTQSADIVRAQEWWKAYQEGRRRGKTK